MRVVGDVRGHGSGGAHLGAAGLGGPPAVERLGAVDGIHLARVVAHLRALGDRERLAARAAVRVEE